MTIPNGRGRDWARKVLTKRRARRIARYQLGLLADAVLSDGWAPDALVERFGEEGLTMIKDQMMDLALWLRETSDPDGLSAR